MGVVTPSFLRRVGALLAAFLVVLALGIWMGGHPESLPGGVRDTLVDDEDTRVVREALDRIEDRYYRDVPADELANAAIEGAVESLDDRFSAYFDPEEYNEVLQAQNSQFTGIGVTVTEHPAGLRIVGVYDDTPAQRAGLDTGDVIVAVEGKSLEGVDQQRSTDRIKGPAGTEVTLTISREGKRREVVIERANVQVPVVESELRTVDGEKLGVVSLSQFSSGAHAELYTAIRELDEKGAKGFVLDLRGNGGGLVSEARLVASAFLRDGLIVTTRGRSVPTRRITATGNPVVPEEEVVVLVNEDTASASEIVAGALQDRDRGIVVGESTFGKGVFQEVLELSNGGALDITAGQYFTPGGRNLGGRGTEQGKGIQPDVKASDDPETEDEDEALDVALQELRERT